MTTRRPTTDGGNGRTERPPSDGLPRAALYAAFGMVIFTLVLVFSDQALDAWRGEQTTTAPQTAYQLWFDDRADGSIAVLPGPDAAPVVVLSQDESGFVRSVVRSLADVREREGIGDAVGFQLVRWTDGTTILADPTTGQYMPLNGFGRDNDAAFAQLVAAMDERS